MIRSIVEAIAIGGLYVIGAYWAVNTYNAPPTDLTGKPCGGSVNNHWQWGGDPDDIQPVCVPKPIDERAAKR